MPLPSCLCVSGRPPFERLGDIFCALGQIDLECVVPTLLSATIDVTGGFITLVFDEDVTSNGSGFTIALNISGDASLTPVSGQGTETLVFSIDPDATEGETAVLSYDASNGNAASGECLLEGINEFPVTNNTGTQFSYLRPGGAFTYFRPGGVDTYLRP